MFPPISNIPIQEIKDEVLSMNNVTLLIQREDLIHPEISGNKWRKLKYNINEYFDKKCECIVTFGGAFSNHIAATAAAGAMLGIPTYGIIRGEKVENSTLTRAKENGMGFCFVSRDEYKLKEEGESAKIFIKSLSKPYVIPEGGANVEGLLGCSEILNESIDFDSVFLACGTGNTSSGVISSLKPSQKAIGVSVLKGGGFLNDEIAENLQLLNSKNYNWEVELDFHFGGYAKYKPELLEFIQWFWKVHRIQLDPVYTGKAMFALFEWAKSGRLQNQKVLFIHTGGLQGITGFEKRYRINLFEG